MKYRVKDINGNDITNNYPFGINPQGKLFFAGAIGFPQPPNFNLEYCSEREDINGILLYQNDKVKFENKEYKIVYLHNDFYLQDEELQTIPMYSWKDYELVN